MNARSSSFAVPDIAPVVIIGMHRSGTSFLSKALDRCGLFMGDDAQGNHESMLFMQINNGILINCYATWNRPFSSHLALQNANVVSSLAQYAYGALEAHVGRYLGSERSDAVAGIPAINFPWGWKDPRNTFTLPVWKHIFPRLKIIHIIRHGVDVANSLYQRDTAGKGGMADFPALGVVQDRFGLCHARPYRSLEGAFSLWEEYVEKAQQQVSEFGNEALQLKYEDLLSEPAANLEKILAFSGLANKAAPPDLLASVKPDRAYSFRKDSQLVQCAAEWQDALSRFGYGPEGESS